MQAAVYTDRFSDSTLPAPVATSNEVTVTNEKGLAQNPNRRPLKVEDGELVEVGSESTPSLTSIQGVTVGTTSREQYDTLESVTLADPFTVRVTNNSRARQGGKVEITAYYDEFEEAPNDTLGPASIPGGYDKDGIAEFTIGSAETGADLETGIAPGSVSNDMTHINQIRFENVPADVQVETQ